ncbi:MAG: N(4)-(beta-N-acetylglucosaminyl)-L-asparaginase [Chloroflexi bacterium]|jgi:beta-aspartyl-peptidase (threonine type)|nr:N(4)-(beta-N-acetylglucosaminyl)-L-asparaginase [Chloroflexota bacterium]
MRVVVTNSVGVAGIQTTVDALLAGRPVLDAIELGIQQVELDPEIHSVGRGGWPNLLGQVELDASIMDGRTLRSGAVGALQGYLHPISVARQVMERLPHVLLVGEGAARFAAEWGMVAGENLTPEARAGWEKWRREHVSPAALANWPAQNLTALAGLTADPFLAHGTTTFLVRGDDGHIASGVSTSGWAWKYPGRLGDSPIIGAGSYADQRYGAAACIGQGELTIRAGTSRAVVLYMKMGMTVHEAVREAARDLEALDRDYHGMVTIHAIDRDGDHCVLTWGAEQPEDYCVWTDGLAAPETRRAAMDW